VFGLGFDTASEIALLGISVAAAATALPLVNVLGLPLLFAADDAHGHTRRRLHDAGISLGVFDAVA